MARNDRRDHLQKLREIFPDCEYLTDDNGLLFWDMHSKDYPGGYFIHPIYRNKEGKPVANRMIAWTLCGQTLLIQLCEYMKKAMEKDKEIIGFVIYENTLNYDGESPYFLQEESGIRFVTSPEMKNFTFEP